MMVWLAELILLVVGVIVLINGWIIPWLGMGFLLLCLAGEVYGVIGNKRPTSKDAEKKCETKKR